MDDRRGTCPRCLRRPMLRGDGRLTGHNDKQPNGEPCPGSYGAPMRFQPAERELDISPLIEPGRFGNEQAMRALITAIRLAGEAGTTTYLVDWTGKTIARLAPVTGEQS